MDADQDLEYHRERARYETDMCYRAEHRGAAEAHMRLSALHMERLKQLDESSSASAPAPVQIAG